MIQIGSIGLIKAVRGFDTSSGNNLSTYAVPLIMGEIKKFLRDDGLIKVSRETKHDAMTVSAARNDFIKEKGEEPKLSDLEKICDMTHEKIVSAISVCTPILSLYGSDDDAGIENTVGCDNWSELFEKLSLKQAINTLPESEKSIMILRYFKNLSQKQTGEALGMTQVMVSRKEKKILEKLKNELT